MSPGTLADAPALRSTVNSRARIGRDLFFELDAVRRKLASVDPQSTLGRLWLGVQRVAAQAPLENPWTLPFVAAVTGDLAMVRAAKAAIDRYLDLAERRGSAGYLYNIWCFSFPHCRWAMWFDLLRGLDAYTPAEEAAAIARFMVIQHRDMHAGLLVKPYPECVDNQGASLCLADLVLGTLFAKDPDCGDLARVLRAEGATRVEAMLGGMPPSGYSGEGSTYQGRIVAFATPFLLEMLEDLRSADLFDLPLRPNGTSARAILQMTARLWMPGGLLLPWDDYGYQHGIKFPLAYLAARSGDDQYLTLLERDANWSRFNCESAGWGFDEVIWALIYWPQRPAPDAGWLPWVQPEVGGTLVSPDGSRYLMQMWDHTSPMCVREHVNPNSLVFTVDGIPLCADGTPDDKDKGKNADALCFAGATHERNFGGGKRQVLNLSKGCAGAHNALLVDGWEGLRPHSRDYDHSYPVGPPDASTITGDVTGLYRGAGIDATCIRRRSRLIDNSFWLIEDLAACATAHAITSRWYFRPDVTAAPGGVDILTPEDVGLQLRALLGSGDATVTHIPRYPRTPDGDSDRVDFSGHGAEVRWLWVAWPTTHCTLQDIPDAAWEASPLGATGATYAVSPRQSPWLLADVPVVAEWEYRTTLQVPAGGDWKIRLPAGVSESVTLTLNGQYVPILNRRGGLLPIVVDCPDHCRSHTIIKLRLTLSFPDGERKEHSNTGATHGPVQLALPATPETLTAWTYDGETVTLTTSTGRTLTVPHALMTPEDSAR